MTLQQEIRSKGSPRGLRERKKTATRESLRDAALLLFTQKGFAGTSVDEIAATAAVSRSTFFRYFGSKEAVLFELGDERGAMLVDLMIARPAGEPRSRVFEEALVEMSLAVEADSERDRARMIEELFRHDEHLMMRRINDVERWTEAVAFAFAHRRGAERPDAEDELAAATCIAATQLIGNRWTRPDSPDVEAVIRETFASMRRIYC